MEKTTTEKRNVLRDEELHGDIRLDARSLEEVTQGLKYEGGGNWRERKETPGELEALFPSGWPVTALSSRLRTVAAPTIRRGHTSAVRALWS